MLLNNDRMLGITGSGDGIKKKSRNTDSDIRFGLININGAWS